MIRPAIAVGRDEETSSSTTMSSSCVDSLLHGNGSMMQIFKASAPLEEEKKGWNAIRAGWECFGGWLFFFFFFIRGIYGIPPVGFFFPVRMSPAIIVDGYCHCRCWSAVTGRFFFLLFLPSLSTVPGVVWGKLRVPSSRPHIVWHLAEVVETRGWPTRRPIFWLIMKKKVGNRRGGWILFWGIPVFIGLIWQFQFTSSFLLPPFPPLYYPKKKGPFIFSWWNVF